MNAQESDGQQTSSLDGCQPGSPGNSTSSNMVSTKLSCSDMMYLPLGAHKPGSLFGVGSAPMLALPTQGPLAKPAKSKAIDISATALKWQSCSEVAKRAEQVRSRGFGHLVSTRCFNRNGCCTYRRTTSGAPSDVSWSVIGSSAGSTHTYVNAESKHVRGRTIVKVRTHVPLIRGL